MSLQSPVLWKPCSSPIHAGMWPIATSCCFWSLFSLTKDENFCLISSSTWAPPWNHFFSAPGLNQYSRTFFQWSESLPEHKDLVMTLTTVPRFVLSDDKKISLSKFKYQRKSFVVLNLHYRTAVYLVPMSALIGQKPTVLYTGRPIEFYFFCCFKFISWKQ